VRVKREPITGDWGRRPQRGPRVEPLVGEGSGALKAFWLFNVPQSRKIYPVLPRDARSASAVLLS